MCSGRLGSRAHLVGRAPVRPIDGFADLLRAGPAEPLAAHGDGIAQRLGGRLDEEQLPTLVVDDNAADGVTAGKDDAAGRQRRDLGAQATGADARTHGTARRETVVVPAPARGKPGKAGDRVGAGRVGIAAVRLVVPRRRPPSPLGERRAADLDAGRRQYERRNRHAYHRPFLPRHPRVPDGGHLRAVAQLSEVARTPRCAIGPAVYALAGAEPIHSPLRNACQVPSAPITRRQPVYFPFSFISHAAAAGTSRSSSTSCRGVSGQGASRRNKARQRAGCSRYRRRAGPPHSPERG